MGIKRMPVYVFVSVAPSGQNRRHNMYKGDSMYQTAFHSYDHIFIHYKDSHKKMNMKVQHYHDSYEIYLQTGGERYLFLDEICYTLKPGDLYVLRPFAIHYTESKDSSHYSRYVINFREEHLEGYLSDTQKELLVQHLESGIYHLDPEQYDQVLTLFKMLQTMFTRTGFLAKEALNAGLICLLSFLYDTLRDHKVTKELSATSNIQPEIIEAIRYLNLHYMDMIALDSVADQVHMSKYHFCRLFHQATGATFLEYLYNIRLSKVHQLLLGTNLPLAEIARKTGFSSTAHLSRVFHSVYQISPRDFRKNAVEAKE